MKVAVFGSTGMLGKAVVKALYSAGATAVPYSRQQCDIAVRSDVLIALLRTKVDAVINCAGARPGKPAVDMAMANTAGPQLLAYHAERMGIRMLHVSTDCVFDATPGEPGRRRTSDEIDPPRDLYGLTKLAGEPSGDNVRTVRTSFVGPDHGALGWLLEADARGQSVVEGWMNAYWTGSTVDVVADALVVMLEDDVFPKLKPVVHLATGSKVSKYEVLRLAKDVFKLKVTVAGVVEPRIDRALKPDVVLPPIDVALASLAKEMTTA